MTTSEFATLDESTKKCKNGANYVDCVSQMYKEALIDQCNCLQYRLQNYSDAMKVIVSLGKGSSRTNQELELH